MSQAKTNMAHNIHDHSLVTRFESTESSNIMETYLVSSPRESNVDDNGELENVTNHHMKVSIRLSQAKIETNIQTPQVATTAIRSRVRNHKSATMQQSASQQNFFGMSASSTFAGDISPNFDLMEQDMRQNSNCKTGYTIQ